MQAEGQGFDSPQLHQPPQEVVHHSPAKAGGGGLLGNDLLATVGRPFRLGILWSTMWHYVYVLENNEGRQYVGFTENLKKRLEKHNNGEVLHTSKYRPWQLKCACSFPTKEQAVSFEKYLKSGSGTMFRYRHLVLNQRRAKIGSRRNSSTT